MTALSPDLVEFVHGGVALSIATRDAELRPAFTRGWGPLVSEDGARVTFSAMAPPGSATRANLEENGATAIGFSPPTIARALQVKGHAIEVREPRPEDIERAERHLHAFTDETEVIGYPAVLSQRLFDRDDLLLVTVEISEVFDQTPGPGAGTRL